MPKNRLWLALLGASIALLALLLHYAAAWEAYTSIPEHARIVKAWSREGGGFCILVRGVPRGAVVEKAVLTAPSRSVVGEPRELYWERGGLVVCLENTGWEEASIVLYVSPPFPDRLLGIPGARVELKLPPGHHGG